MNDTIAIMLAEISESCNRWSKLRVLIKLMNKRLKLHYKSYIVDPKRISWWKQRAVDEYKLLLPQDDCSNDVLTKFIQYECRYTVFNNLSVNFA